MLNLFLEFLQINPEFKGVVWLVFSYMGLYVFLFLATRMCIAIRGSAAPPPYLDRIVHLVVFCSFVLMALLPMLLIYELNYSPIYHILWYHFVAYSIFCLPGIFVCASLIQKIRQR